MLEVVEVTRDGAGQGEEVEEGGGGGRKGGGTFEEVVADVLAEDGEGAELLDRVTQTQVLEEGRRHPAQGVGGSPSQREREGLQELGEAGMPCWAG